MNFDQFSITYFVNNIYSAKYGQNCGKIMNNFVRIIILTMEIKKWSCFFLIISDIPSKEIKNSFDVFMRPQPNLLLLFNLAKKLHKWVVFLLKYFTWQFFFKLWTKCLSRYSFFLYRFYSAFTFFFVIFNWNQENIIF